jgi:hypothetical protein
MSILIIDDQSRQRVQRLAEFALSPENHYRPGGGIVPGDDSRFVIMLGSYRCVFTYTRLSSGLFRHLSVSVGQPGKWPMPQAVEMIGQMFGFVGPFASWIKSLDTHSQSVVVAELINELTN